MINGKIYIGSAVNLNKRKYDHFYDLKKNLHRNKYLQSSYNKHGKDNFKFDYIKNISILIEREQYYLDKYFDNCKKCYNIHPNAKSPLGIKRKKTSKETRLKMAISNGAKPFYVFKDKKLVGEWVSKSICAEELRKLLTNQITQCLNNIDSNHHGYVFIYKSEFSEEKLEQIY